MIRTRREQLAAMILIVLLLIGCGWCLSWLQTSRNGALAAGEQLAEARRLIARIENLRNRPAAAGKDVINLGQLTRLIELAAAEAGLQREQLVRIWPAPARRHRDGDYQEKPIQVLLERLTLKQLSQFLLALTGNESPLTLTSIRLTAPHRTVLGEEEETWTCELTASYLLYAPRTSDSSESARLRSVASPSRPIETP